MSSREDLYEKLNDIFVFDVLMTSDTGGDLSIMDQVKHISIYEDVTSTCVRAELSFTDGQGLINNFPIVGQETIKIKFVTPGMGLAPTTYKLDVVGILERTKSNSGKSELVKLDLISSQARLNKASRISQTFRGNIGSIVSNIFTNYLYSEKPVAIEPTINQITYCVPNKNPIETIQWLAAKSISGESSPGSYNYLFFENAASFVFSSLDKMASQESHFKYILSTETPVSANPTSTPNLISKIYNIEEINFTKSFNRLSEMSDGMYESKLLVHDITLKSIKENKFNYYVDFFKLNHIESFPTLPARINKYASSEDTKLIVKNRQSGLFTGSPGSQNFESYLQYRGVSLAEYDINKIEIVVPGNSILTVGTPVYLDLPKAEPLYKENTNRMDEYSSGKYLVTAIRHMIDLGTKPIYKNVVQLSRGSSPVRFSDKTTFDGREGEKPVGSGVFGIMDFFKGLF